MCRGWHITDRDSTVFSTGCWTKELLEANQLKLDAAVKVKDEAEKELRDLLDNLPEGKKVSRARGYNVPCVQALQSR